MAVLQAEHADGLSLEPLHPDHAAALYPVLADLRLYRWLDYGPPASQAALRGLFERMAVGHSADGRELWLNWALRLQSDQLAGYVQATVLQDGRAWVAYVLGSAWQGRGLARAAVSRMLHFLQQDHGCCHFMATIEAANLPSARLLQTQGFRQATAAEAQPHGLSGTEQLWLRGDVPAAAGA